jgi:hypothetical protein
MTKGVLMILEVFDKSESMDIIIYKFQIGSIVYLAEVEISTKKLITLRDYDRYMQDLTDDIFLVGEAEFNQAVRYLKDKGIIKN